MQIPEKPVRISRCDDDTPVKDCRGPSRVIRGYLEKSHTVCAARHSFLGVGDAAM